MLQLKTLSYADAHSVLSLVRKHDMRLIDQIEFEDSIPKSARSNFNTYLKLALGLQDMDCRVVYVTADGKPAYIAVSAKPGYSTHSDYKNLTGFGWSKADSRVNKAERMDIMKYSIEQLILEDSECDEFRCYVHKDNWGTLKAWAIIEKRFRQKLQVVQHLTANTDYFEFRITKKR